MTSPHFKPGIDTLLDSHKDRLAGRKIGLVTHPAALDLNGRTTDERLAGLKDFYTLVALFAPEHGFFSAAGAGEKVDDMRHPLWDIPIHSLYGSTRRPTDAMLDGLDLIIIDLQDISIRPYTYGSTLRYVMEAAASHNIPVIVCDRPDPLARVIDGPMLDPALESFVGAIPAPFAYGMTIGETALYLKDILALDLDLFIAPINAYSRDPHRMPYWHPWIPPSPSIRTWETAILYPITVLLEALPCLDHGRSTSTPFQLIGAPWINGHALANILGDIDLPGIRVHPCAYSPNSGRYSGQTLQGIRMTLTDRFAFRPLQVSVTGQGLLSHATRSTETPSPLQTFVRIFSCIRDQYGADRLWADPATRPDFFDQLAGTQSLRHQLQANTAPDTIIDRWINPLRAFEKTQSRYLLYAQR